PAGARDRAGAPRPGRSARCRVPHVTVRANHRLAHAGRRAARGCGPVSRDVDDQRRRTRADRASELRRRGARNPRAARCLSQRGRIAHAAGGAGRGSPASGNRIGVRQRLGDPVMRHLLSAILIGTLAAAGCTRGGDARAGAAAETPTLDVTSWTDKSELFMEHPPLVAGETIRFAVHLTKLEDFSALNAGRPSIEMTPESGGSPVTLAGSDPLRPGAFRVEGKIPPAGRYRWALLVNAPGL